MEYETGLAKCAPWPAKRKITGKIFSLTTIRNIMIIAKFRLTYINGDYV
jgi:hypothetical protein